MYTKNNLQTSHCSLNHHQKISNLHVKKIKRGREGEGEKRERDFFFPEYRENIERK